MQTYTTHPLWLGVILIERPVKILDKISQKLVMKGCLNAFVLVFLIQCCRCWAIVTQMKLALLSVTICVYFSFSSDFALRFNKARLVFSSVSDVCITWLPSLPAVHFFYALLVFGAHVPHFWTSIVLHLVDKCG